MKSDLLIALVPSTSTSSIVDIIDTSKIVASFPGLTVLQFGFTIMLFYVGRP